MQICEYFFENACYSVTKYYLCKQNNKRSLLGRKQRHQVVRSFPNRYLFSLTNKLTFLFPISCILDIILCSKIRGFQMELPGIICNTSVSVRLPLHRPVLLLWQNLHRLLCFSLIVSGSIPAYDMRLRLSGLKR